MVLFRYLCATVILAASSGGVTAQNRAYTPNDVYQTVDQAVNELKALYAADRQETPEPAVTNAAERAPRHVYFKAREVFLKIQKLRGVNGLAFHALPAAPVRPITPTIVLGLTGDPSADPDNISQNAILIDLQELKPRYYVSVPSPEAPLPNGKKPTDVYLALAYASQLIDGLDTPSVVPNDVYSVALQVLAEARIIASAEGAATAEAGIEAIATGKKPGDVYDAGESLLDVIAGLNESQGYGISGGVVKPLKPAGAINPGHVMDLMSNTLAELNAIKLAKGITENAPLPGEQSGKTPSNVYDVIETTKRVLAGI